MTEVIHAVYSHECYSTWFNSKSEYNVFFFPPSYVHLKFIYVDGYLNLNNTTVDIANPQLHHKVAL